MTDPPLKTPKSNIFGQNKLGESKTNNYKRFGQKKIAKICTEKYFVKNIFRKILQNMHRKIVLKNNFRKIFFIKYFFSGIKVPSIFVVNIGSSII